MTRRAAPRHMESVWVRSGADDGNDDDDDDDDDNDDEREREREEIVLRGIKSPE